VGGSFLVVASARGWRCGCGDRRFAVKHMQFGWQLCITFSSASQTSSYQSTAGFDAKEMYIADTSTHIVMHVIIESGLDDRGSIPVTSRYFALQHTRQTVSVKL
jgi:hypothetical protein